MSFLRTITGKRTEIILAAFAYPFAAFADDVGVLISGIPDCDFVTGKLGPACIPLFIGHLVAFVYSFVGMFFVLNVMYAGYQLAIAYIGGSDKGAGKDRLKWSIAGLVVCTCIYLILDLVLGVVLGS